jgi:hypothetical protein
MQVAHNTQSHERWECREPAMPQVGASDAVTTAFRPGW